MVKQVAADAVDVDQPGLLQASEAGVREDGAEGASVFVGLLADDEALGLQTLHRATDGREELQASMRWLRETLHPLAPAPVEGVLFPLCWERWADKRHTIGAGDVAHA